MPAAVPAGLAAGLGDFDLSQQVFTIMSYNDGWQTSPYGQPRSGGLTGTEVDHFGWVGTLSPLDIAVIQDKYGVNEDTATGNDTYTLADASGPGVFHQAIWDAGGIDQILYTGARDATIDLRAATLAYEEGGGGRVSFANGVFGGFTIANGVTIEDARSGSGNDDLFGNDAANRLTAGDGADHLDGGAGNDTLVGGPGLGRAHRRAWRRYLPVRDRIADSQVGPGRDHITDFAKGSDVIDLTLIDASRFIGTGLFSGRTGEVRYAAFDGGTIIEVDTNGDRLADFQIELDSLGRAFHPGFPGHRNRRQRTRWRQHEKGSRFSCRLPMTGISSKHMEISTCLQAQTCGRHPPTVCSTKVDEVEDREFAATTQLPGPLSTSRRCCALRDRAEPLGFGAKSTWGA